MSKCGCSLKDLKHEYSLEEAMLIWESYHVGIVNEYQAIERAKRDAERKMKQRRR